MQPTAKSFLAALVLNKTVEVKEYGLGRYARVLGVIRELRDNGKAFS